MMACFGLILGTVGMDTITGSDPLHLRSYPTCIDGIGLVPLVMGLFGISEVLLNLEKAIEREMSSRPRSRGSCPTVQDWTRFSWAILRGTVHRLLPGNPSRRRGDHLLLCLLRDRKDESPNIPRSSARGPSRGWPDRSRPTTPRPRAAFIPLLTLGIPANVVMAMLLGRPDDPRHAAGPAPAHPEHPDLFWGVIASMYVGNVMLLVLNLPLIGLWVQLFKIPYPFLMPLIILFCVLGSYSVANSITDVLLMLLFGLIGYLMKKLKFDAPPLVLAFVLGPLIEYYFKSSLMFSRGSFTVFFTRPISLACLSISAAILLWSIVSGLRRRPLPIPKEEP